VDVCDCKKLKRESEPSLTWTVIYRRSVKEGLFITTQPK